MEESEGLRKLNSEVFFSAGQEIKKLKKQIEALQTENAKLKEQIEAFESIE